MDCWAGSTLWACQKHTEILIMKSHWKPPCLRAWHKAGLIKRRDPGKNRERTRRDINDCKSASRALSQPKQPPAELNGSFLSCLERWLEAAWQCLPGRQFLAHGFIWAGQFALVLRHSDKHVLNHWQTQQWSEGQQLNQHLRSDQRRRRV